MKPVQHTFEELSRLKYSIYTCPYPSMPEREFLIVAFGGEYRSGPEGDSDGLFMTAIVKAALAVWSGWGLILDFRKLKFEGGDAITHALGAGEQVWDDLHYPTRIVCTETSRAAVEKVLGEQLCEDPAEWIFDSYQPAVSSLETHLLRYRNTARHKLG
jgi:hypothetical protein